MNNTQSESNLTAQPQQRGASDSMHWSVHEVGEWLNRVSLEMYRDAFYRLSVDGSLLFRLTIADLKEMEMIDLHANKCIAEIQRLKHERK